MPEPNFVNKTTRRRPAQRPAEILAAAERVFSRFGYERATTRQIAAEAGVSEGTLYNYFPSKRDILIALFDFTHDALNGDFENLEANDLEEALVQLISRRLHFAKKHPTTILSLQQAMLDPEIGRHLDAIISQSQDQVIECFHALFEAGALRPIDPFVAEEALGSMLMGLTIGVELSSRGHHREPLSPEQIARALVDVLMNGLRVSQSNNPTSSGKNHT